MSLLILSACLAIFAQANDASPVTLEKISEGVYLVVGGRGSNGGIIIGETGVMAVDSKMNEESVRQTLAAIENVTDKPLLYLVSTHSDGDHIMGNRYFPNPVTFIAHENSRNDFFNNIPMPLSSRRMQL